MQRLSSKSTFLYKRIFPVVMIVFLAIFVMIGTWGDWGSAKGAPLPFFIIPVLFLAIAVPIFRKFVLDLVDEVWDAGDALVVRNKGMEDRILLSDIMNVSYSPLMNPPRVTLRLRTPSRFGDRVSFAAPRTAMQLFSENPLIDQLIVRVDAARQGAR